MAGADRAAPDGRWERVAPQRYLRFDNFSAVVGAALANPGIGGSPACYNAVAAGVGAAAQLVNSTSPFGTDSNLPAALRPCAAGGFSSGLDLATWQANVFGTFQGLVQYNMEVPNQPTVAVVCGIMTDSAVGPPIARVAAVASAVNKANGADDCVPSSFVLDAVAPLANATFSAPDCNLTCASIRQWVWQSCNEFGFFQTTTAPAANHPFSALGGNDVGVAGRATCEAAFGLDGYTGPLARESNTRYGGRDIAGANVSMVNGNMDPWHALSVVNASDRFFESCVDPDGSRPAPGSSGSDCPAQRDLFGEVVAAMRKKKMMVGAYFSKADWHSHSFWVRYCSCCCCCCRCCCCRCC